MQEYASLDVPEKHWLPVAFSAGGAYTAPSSVTAQARANYGDTAPYGMSSYEEPIHRRVCEEYGAGQLWHDNRDNLCFVLPSRLRDEGISQERMHWPIAISTTAATAACGGSCPDVMPCAMSTTRPTV